jgi:hypothetical protein
VERCLACEAEAVGTAERNRLWGGQDQISGGLSVLSAASYLSRHSEAGSVSRFRPSRPRKRGSAPQVFTYIGGWRMTKDLGPVRKSEFHNVSFGDLVLIEQAGYPSLIHH